jgi:hypothetical protein
MSFFKIVVVALLAVTSTVAQAETKKAATAASEGGPAYIGAGLGIPSVAYGSSSLAVKLFGGYKINQFDIKEAGKLDLAIQGEYIDFGSSSAHGASWSQSGVAVAAVASWVVPRKWAPWADEKVAVLVKAGGARVAYSSNNGFDYTATGLTQGIGADYNFNSQFAVRAMIEYFPGSYSVNGISGVFRF